MRLERRSSVRKRDRRPRRTMAPPAPDFRGLFWVAVGWRRLAVLAFFLLGIGLIRTDPDRMAAGISVKTPPAININIGSGHGRWSTKLLLTAASGVPHCKRAPGDSKGYPCPEFAVGTPSCNDHLLLSKISRLTHFKHGRSGFRGHSSQRATRISRKSRRVGPNY